MKSYTVQRYGSRFVLNERSAHRKDIKNNIPEGSNFTVTISDLWVRNKSGSCCRDITDKPQLCWLTEIKLHVACTVAGFQYCVRITSFYWIGSYFTHHHLRRAGKSDSCHRGTDSNTEYICCVQIVSPQHALMWQMLKGECVIVRQKINGWVLLHHISHTQHKKSPHDLTPL